MRLLRFQSWILALVLSCACVRAELVTINSQVSGKGVVLGGGTVESGTQITLRAVAEVDWKFDHWEGVPGEPAQNNPITLTAAAGLQPTAVMISADGTGRFAGAPVVVIPTSTYEPATNVPAGLTAIAVSAAGTNALALKPDGTVAQWSVRATGPVTGSTAVSNVVAINAGLFHALAVKTDGTVVAGVRVLTARQTCPLD